MRAIVRMVLAITYAFLLILAIYLPFTKEGATFFSLLTAGVAVGGATSLAISSLRTDRRPWLPTVTTLLGTTILVFLSLGCSVLFAFAMREPAAYAAYSFVVFLVFSLYQLAVYHPDFEGLPHLPLSLTVACMLFGAPMVFVAMQAPFLIPLAVLLLVWMLFLAAILVLLPRSGDAYLESMLLFCATAALMIGAVTALFVAGPILFPPLLVIIVAGLAERYLAAHHGDRAVETAAPTTSDVNG